MAHVQSRTLKNTSAAHALAFTTNVTAGNALVVAFRANASPIVTGISDNHGNTYSFQGQLSDGTRRLSVWVVQNAAAGATTVTITTNVSATTWMIISEWDSVPTSGVVEDFANATFAAATSVTSPAVDTTVTGDTIVGILVTSSAAASIAPAGGETERQELADVNFQLQDKTVGAAGSYTSSWTLGAAQPGVVAAIALRKSGAAGVDGNAGGSLPTLALTAPLATATSNQVTVGTLRALTFDSRSKPSRLTTKFNAADPNADMPGVTELRWTVTGGTGTVVVDPDGRLQWDSTVTQITWAWYNGTVWSDDLTWDLRGLFPFFTGPSVTDKVYTSGAAIAAEDYSPLFSDSDTAAVDLTYSVQGTPVPGLSIDPDTGIVTGTPSLAGTYPDLRVRCTDTEGSYAETNLFIRTVATAPNPPFFLGTIGPSFQVFLTATFPDIDCSVNFQFCTSFTLTGTLPPGLSFNTSTGVISGQPTAIGVFGGLTVTGNGTGTPAVSNSFGIEVVDGSVNVNVDLPTFTVTAPTAIGIVVPTWTSAPAPDSPVWTQV